MVFCATSLRARKENVSTPKSEKKRLSFSVAGCLRIRKMAAVNFRGFFLIGLGTLALCISRASSSSSETSKPTEILFPGGGLADLPILAEAQTKTAWISSPSPCPIASPHWSFSTKTRRRNHSRSRRTPNSSITPHPDTVSLRSCGEYSAHESRPLEKEACTAAVTRMK